MKIDTRHKREVAFGEGGMLRGVDENGRSTFVEPKRGLDAFGLLLADAIDSFCVGLVRVPLPELLLMVFLVELVVVRERGFRAANGLLVLIGGELDERGFIQQVAFASVADDRQSGLVGEEHVRDALATTKPSDRMKCGRELTMCCPSFSVFTCT